MWLIIAIVALTIVLDQVTKYLVASQMTIGQSIPIIDNFYTLHHIVMQVQLGEFFKEK